MPELSLGWQKTNVIAQILTPIVLLFLGFAYSYQQQRHEMEQKSADRVASNLKSFASDRVEEREYAMEMLLWEKENYPSKYLDHLIDKLAPTLVKTYRQYQNPEESEKAKHQLQVIAQTDPALATTINQELTRIDNGPQWAIVIGGDDTPKGADDRVNKAKKEGFSNLSIYKKRNSYRTIIKFSNKGEADSKINDARSKLSPEAYIVNLSLWCQKPTQNNGYSECSNE